MFCRATLALIALLATVSCGSREDDIEKNFRVHTGGAGGRIPIQLNDQYGFASATGIWTIEGEDKIADPINITQIYCNRQESYCEEHRSWVTNLTDRPSLMADSEMYKVTDWSADKVVSISEGPCRSTEIIISKSDNTVIAITRQGANCSDDGLAKLEAPRYQRLISGEQLDKNRE